jgi:glycosyltransferase involved in cell wall biosynthesis
MPAYNAAAWLPRSVPRLSSALKKANIKKAEIIIVNDGSSDDTEKVAQSLKVGYPVKVISQPNAGRFIARDSGVKAAKYEYILFIDTRIFIGENSLKYIGEKISSGNEKVVWTSHVFIDRNGNPYARFWEAITFIAWRKYFANPRDCSFGIKDFDYYPKGTTCFFVPTAVISEANDWFVTQTKNEKASNDDTLLIRRIAENYPINLSPNFNCQYHARTNLKQYCKHVFHRGKVFVDGFLRRDGNRFYWLLISFLMASVILPVCLIIFPELFIPVIAVFGVAWVLELLAAIALRVPIKDAASLFILSPLFAVFYGAGIWTAVFDIYVRPKRFVSEP